MRRMMTRARGSGSTIRKRSSHIRIVLTDEIEIKKREKMAGKKKGATKKKSTRGKTKAAKESPQVTKAEAGEEKKES